MGAPRKLIDLTFCSFFLLNWYFVDNIDSFTNYNQETVDSTHDGDCLDFLQLLTFSRQDVCDQDRDETMKNA